MTLPGVLWLLIFFAAPLFVMLSFTLYEGSIELGYVFNPDWTTTYADALGSYDTQIIRSVLYGLVVTLSTLLVSFPAMYWIATRGGKRKNLYLLLILLPFFTPFVIRILSWKFVLADQGILLGTLKDIGLLPADYHALATPFAVLAGMFYDFLPFMALPLYVALERLDPALLEASSDLYATRRETFLRVTLPLALPGVFAGSLLTFIPSVGDFIHAELLGGPEQTMVGNVIQRLLLVNGDFPTATALALLLIVGILIGIFAYARALGTEELTG
jgi:spermidine/putrescine transport system permease protein